MEFKRLMYVESISSSAVQFRRLANTGPIPDSNPGVALHQVNIVTGNAAAANADSTVFLVDCAAWEVTFRKLG